MVEQEQVPQIKFLLSEFNTRLKDTEERNKLIKERVLLLGKNFISSKGEIDKEIKILKKEAEQNQRDLGKLISLTQNILSETEKFVRKDEVIIIERMLKDFQPLEFVREKDVLELIDERLSAKNSEALLNKNE